VPLAGCSGPSGPGAPQPAATATSPNPAGATTSPRSAPTHSPAPAQSPVPSSSPEPDHRPAAPHNLEGLLNSLADAVDTGNRAEFTALFTDRDPGFRQTADMIWDNLDAIRPSPLALRATGDKHPLSKRRASVLGKKAYAAEVRVRWAVPGDTAASDQRVWMTVVPTGSGLRWGGIVDAPSAPDPTPLWWLEPVQFRHNRAATVIAGARVDVGRWLAAANTAVTRDTSRLRGADWNHHVVIVVPSTEQLMERSLGVSSGSDSQLAAVSWADGSTGHPPIRIMINPDGQPSALATAIVLAHETVHVATRSPVSRAPSWLVEGYADYIAYLNYPQAVQPAAERLLADVKRDDPPAALPGEDDFTAGHHDLNRSYAEAWTLCRYLADRYGDQQLWRFYRTVDASPDGSISGAAHQVFKISEHQLVAGWQRYLRTAAARGRI
jgi:hypothetical protein